MLVRLSVVVGDEKFAAFLSEILSGEDAVVQLHLAKGKFWEQVSTACDVLLVGLSRLPSPADDSIRSLCRLPNSPQLVILTDSEDPELRATLLAAGADGVLSPALDPDIWMKALRQIMEGSFSDDPKVSSEPSTQSNRSGLQHEWLPEGWIDLPWAQLRKTLLSACENEYIRHHLTATRGRVGIVAKRTGLSHRAVSLMMKRQGLSKEPFRD